MIRIIVGFCIALTAIPASAWEFRLSGGLDWTYEGYSQLGSDGLFGRYDIDAGNNPGGYGGALGDAASLNGWVGVQISQLASGSDNARASMSMTFNPEIRINRAVRIRGQYYIGSWGFDQFGSAVGAIASSQYPNSSILGVQQSFSPGYWNMLWVTAQTPWGVLAGGKREFSFGTALFRDGSDNSSSESTLLVAGWGPFRLGVAWFPWRLGSNAYFDNFDKNAVRQVHLGAFTTYAVGPLELGIGSAYVKFHSGPESQVTQAAREAFIPEDTVAMDGLAYIKYYNGRFFFNAETAYFNRIDTRQRWLSAASGIIPDQSGRSEFAPRYLEHWRYAIELGATVGPAKVSLIWSWISGPDRRHGILIDKQADSVATWSAAGFTNTSLFKPYSLILCYNYGGGNNAVSPLNGNGYMTDANMYGARVDHAVAANLNVYGSFFWAERVSNGYGWGFIRPQDPQNPAGTFNGFTGAVEFTRQGSFGTPAPAIPDNHLGWEVDCGFDWRILSGYLISASFGYWQPGRWFNFACIDRSNPGWKTPSPANRFGINPARSIDPVFGIMVILSANF